VIELDYFEEEWLGDDSETFRSQTEGAKCFLSGEILICGKVERGEVSDDVLKCLVWEELEVARNGDGTRGKRGKRTRRKK